MKFQIKQTRLRQFRWFSAGDIPDITSFKKIVQVCEALPDVVFWLPTSRDDILYKYFETQKGKISKNLIIRLSAPVIGAEMPAMIKDMLKRWGVTWTNTTLDEKKATCHASIDGRSCELCEDCFKLEPVTYLIHGKNARRNAEMLQELRK